jgi:hypothetical protein
MRAACLEGALSRSEPCGVWGGELFEDGKVIQTKRAPGRPRLEKLERLEKIESSTSEVEAALAS